MLLSYLYLLLSYYWDDFLLILINLYLKLGGIYRFLSLVYVYSIIYYLVFLFYLFYFDICLANYSNPFIIYYYYFCCCFIDWLYRLSILRKVGDIGWEYPPYYYLFPPLLPLDEFVFKFESVELAAWLWLLELLELVIDY